MQVRLSDVFSGLIALCAMVLTGVVLHREFRPARAPAGRVARALPNAAGLALAGQVIGSDSADLTVVEFSDFQCQYCAQEAKVLAAFRASPQGRIRVVYRHFPLEGIHPLAREAALAAECAAAQGHFAEYHDRLFALQDSIGRLSWGRLAAMSHVPNVSRFGACVRRAEGADAVERDLAVARELDLHATPTLIIGDSLYEGLVAAELLERLLRDKIKRRSHT